MKVEVLYGFKTKQISRLCQVTIYSSNHLKAHRVVLYQELGFLNKLKIELCARKDFKCRGYSSQKKYINNSGKGHKNCDQWKNSKNVKLRKMISNQNYGVTRLISFEHKEAKKKLF